MRLSYVPDTPSAQCLVHIQGYFGDAPDTSDAAFEIVSSGLPDTTAPTVTIGLLGIEGSVNDATIQAVTVGGLPASLVAGTFTAEAILTSGTISISIGAVDAAGNSSLRTLDITTP